MHIFTYFSSNSVALPLGNSSSLAAAARSTCRTQPERTELGSTPGSVGFHTRSAESTQSQPACGGQQRASSRTMQRLLPLRAIRSDLVKGSDHLRQVQTVSREQVDSNDLFPQSHVEEFPVSLLLYAPFGAAIAAVRMLLWVLVVVLDLPWLTDNDTGIKVLQAVLGLQITWTNLEQMPQQRHVMVSNHVTTGDLMVLYSLLQPTVHLISPGLPERACQTQNHRVKLVRATPESYAQLADPHCQESVHLFPGGLTNGKGMMAFSRGFMRIAESANLPVVPVAMKAELPWGLSTHTWTSSFVANLFWFCFPLTVKLEAVVLPPLSQQKGESKAEFVQRTQQSIADELGIPIVELNIQQKRQMVQRLRKLRKG